MNLGAKLDSALIKLRKPSAKLALRALRRNGFSPRSILDIGAYKGKWAATVMHIYPDARFLMIEAQEHMRPRLEELVRQHPDRLVAVIALLGDAARRSVDFNLMEKGSSIFPEMTAAPRNRTTLPMRTCDEVVAESEFRSFDLIKLDVQGAELAVLQGASRILAKAQFVFMEVSVLPYNEGAPSFAEIVRYMDERDFVLFDVVGMMRDPMDVLSQCDLLFIRKDAAIRKQRIEEQLLRYAADNSN
ncbi:MAG: FkbM family methyltransferase [Gammaproteobacteria bacterium]|nr:FkbM family methyltransferase [Gammaproteobacteria bacterium]